jgi:hypothetical protein
MYIISPSLLKMRQVTYAELTEAHSQIEVLLKSERFLHFCVVREGELECKLVYEEFIISPFFFSPALEWPTLLFRYYLRRFLLIGIEKRSLEAVLHRENCFYSSFAPVPCKVSQLITKLKGKSCVVVKHKGKRAAGSLGELLEIGLNQVEKRRAEWEQRRKHP